MTPPETRVVAAPRQACASCGKRLRWVKTPVGLVLLHQCSARPWEVPTPEAQRIERRSPLYCSLCDEEVTHRAVQALGGPLLCEGCYTRSLERFVPASRRAYSDWLQRELEAYLRQRFPGAKDFFKLTTGKDTSPPVPKTEGGEEYGPA